MNIILAINSGLLIFLIVLGVVAVIALISFALYRFLRPSLKENKPDEKALLNEEMNRVLKPIDDEKTAKEVEEYRDEEDD